MPTDGFEGDRIFPLALTPFEHYMLADDRPDYPMTFCIELALTGSLDRAEFTKAAEGAIRRHPLLRAIARRRNIGWEWKLSDHPLSINWTEGEPQLPPLAERFLDIRQVPGIRGWVGRSQNRARAVFQFHHTATDGIGAVRFLGDLLALYGQATASSEQERPELEEMRPEALVHRGRLWHEERPPAGFWRQSVPRLAEFIARRPCGLESATRDFSRPTQLPFDPFVTRILSRTALNRLKTVANGRGVSPNELYLLAMFRTLGRWNQEGGRRPWIRPYRIGVPTSLRTPVHDGSPAANIVSYVFLTRHAAALENQESLLRYIHRESAILLNSGDSRILPLSLSFLARIPGAMALTTRVPFRFVTAILANVGDVKRQLGGRFPLERGRCRAGNVTLETLLGAAPVRPGSSVGTSLGTYGGRLLVNFNCDPLQFSDADSARFADLFVSELCGLAGIDLAEALSEQSIEPPGTEATSAVTPAIPVPVPDPEVSVVALP